MPDKFKFTLFFLPTDLNLSTHTHTNTHTHTCRCQVSFIIHNQCLGDLRWSKTASQERKQSLLKKEKKAEKNELIWPGQPVGPKQMLELIWHQNLPNLNLSAVFYKIWLEHDECLNSSSIWTYPTWTYQAWTAFPFVGFVWFYQNLYSRGHSHVGSTLYQQRAEWRWLWGNNAHSCHTWQTHLWWHLRLWKWQLSKLYFLDFQT